MVNTNWSSNGIETPTTPNGLLGSGVVPKIEEAGNTIKSSAVPWRNWPKRLAKAGGKFAGGPCNIKLTSVRSSSVRIGKFWPAVKFITLASASACVITLKLTKVGRITLLYCANWALTAAAVAASNGIGFAGTVVKYGIDVTSRILTTTPFAPPAVSASNWAL